MAAPFRRRARLVAMTCALLLGLPMVAPGRATAEPALWKVQGPHATVWLFGSVHVLRPDVQWRSARIDAALKSADALWLEIDNADDPAALQPLILRYGLDPAHPLSSRLTAPDKASLDKLMADLGAPASMMEPMRPWVVGMMLDVLPLMKAGYDPNASVEHALSTDARAAGKPVNGFETAEDQVRLFADLPPDQEIAFLHASMDDAANGIAEIDKLVLDWDAGDVSGIERLENDEMKAKYPGLYKLVIVDRNERFARRIAELARGRGVVFAAVGAGHLAGPDSVQADLARLGFTAVRQ